MGVLSQTCKTKGTLLGLRCGIKSVLEWLGEEVMNMQLDRDFHVK